MKFLSAALALWFAATSYGAAYIPNGLYRRKTEAPATEITEPTDDSQSAEEIPLGEITKRDGWLIEEIPAYEGGVLSADIYHGSVGLSDDHMGGKDESEMAVISKTNLEEYKNYLDLLEKTGFIREYENSTEKLEIGVFSWKNLNIYVQYGKETEVTKVNLDKTSVSLSDFTCPADKNGGNTVIYQYGLVMDEKGADPVDENSRTNCGMLYIIKLADNSLFVIDGGSQYQFGDEAIAELDRFLAEITGVKENEKITVRCWFITHPHSDHFGGFFKYLRRNSDKVELERIMYNFPSPRYGGEFAQYYTDRNVLGAGLLEMYPNAMYFKPHTGMKFDIGEVGVEVMYTHEDLVKNTFLTRWKKLEDSMGSMEAAAASGSGVTTARNLNETSTILYLTIEGKKIAILGDSDTYSENTVIENYTPEELKADAVQAAHHAFSNLNKYYEIAKAPLALFPQTSGGVAEFERENRSLVANATQIFYGGDETVGIEIIDGVFKDVYHGAVVGVAGGSYAFE